MRGESRRTEPCLLNRYALAIILYGMNVSLPTKHLGYRISN